MVGDNSVLNHPDIILASASPRRAALLAQIGLPFRICPSTLGDDGESVPPGEDLALSAMRLAVSKAQEVAARITRGVVVGADTIVSLDGRQFGKPRTPDEAHRFLMALSGRTHHVATGLALVNAGSGRTTSACSVTTVRMRAFSAAEAAAYVHTGEPMDKAGAYGIQGKGALLIDSIDGDYFTVVGLPLALLATMLCNFGIDAWRTAASG